MVSGIFFFFWSHRADCGILVPQPGINPRSGQWKAWSPNHWMDGQGIPESEILSFNIIDQTSLLPQYVCGGFHNEMMTSYATNSLNHPTDPTSAPTLPNSPAYLTEYEGRVQKLRPLGKVSAMVGGSEGKESACSAGDPSLISGSGRSPGERNGYPLQYSCLENSMDRGARWATVQGVAKGQTQLLSDWHFHSSFCHGW